MKILIVGAGIGGLTLGAFLENSDIEFEIVEKSVEDKSGYLLVMWDNARDILQKLGLADRFDTGTQIHEYSIRNGRGETLRNYSLKDFYVNYGTAITMTSRQDLCAWLMSKIDVSKLRKGISVTTVAQTDSGVQVTFSTGEIKEYDVVVGADGVHSVVRDQLFRKHAESYENWRSWWVWVDRDQSAPATVIEYIEAEEFVLVFNAGERALAVFTAPIDHTIWDTPDAIRARLKELFQNESAIVSPLLDSAREGAIMPGDLIQIKLKNWVEGKVALLGDAAHCFGPHAGLGGSMAMEDAYVLAGELMKVKNGFSVEQALEAYQKKRMPRVTAAKKLNERMRMVTLTKSKIMRSLISMVTRILPESFLVAQYSRLLKEEI